MTDAPPICPRHPERTAQSVCSVCGSFLCSRCTTAVPRLSPLCDPCDRRVAAKTGAPLRTAALALLAVIVVLQLAYFAAHAIVVNEPAVAWASAARLPDIASFAVYVVWFRRANRSLRDRGYDLEYGPNAWAWNLVPGANLVMPYLALRDIYQRAVLDVGFWLPLWWGGKLTASLLNWFGASALQPTLVSWVQLALFAASEAMLLIVVFRATHGLSNPPEPVELAPVGKVESESAFATFL